MWEREARKVFSSGSSLLVNGQPGVEMLGSLTGKLAQSFWEGNFVMSHFLKMYIPLDSQVPLLRIYAKRKIAQLHRTWRHKCVH